MIRKKHFTLLELMAAMGVLSLFIMALMQFFSTSQEVMSLSTDRAGQYERARIAMDMIAKDLQNIYYQEGVATYCYYQVNDGDNTTELDIAAYRAEKIGDSITNLCRIRYEFDPATRRLRVAALGDTDAGSGWALHKQGDQSVVFPNIAANTFNEKSGVLLEGVKSFAVYPRKVTLGTSYDEDNATIGFGGTNCTVPDLVRIQITLYDSGTEEQLRSMEEAGIDPAQAKAQADDAKNANKLRVFTREVAIDRGQ